MPNTLAALPSSQYATPFELDLGNREAEGKDPISMAGRPCCMGVAVELPCLKEDLKAPTDLENGLCFA